MRFNKENTNGNGYHGHHGFDSKTSSQDALNRIDMHHETRSAMVSRQGNGGGEDDEQIIPWRAHLRKTNSRLSLIG